ncbi:hypothetical protein Sango_1561800 [Sesamum angolense]|uniref:RNase H type-1 domain-containing protein n=1 Tax=Sesamum angolense TaxID=2727404 RepID=A0AAE1WPH8_9LAMI|nr:hypothetical protein Sango_1561800 [Sesamum angolense]
MLHYWKLSSPYLTRGHIRLLIPLLVLWCIWRLRNEAKYDGAMFSPTIIIRRVFGYLWRLQRAKRLQAKHWTGDLLVAKRLHFYYRAPQCNCDLIRDSRGHMIKAYFEFLGAQTNAYAGLYAVIRGLRIAREEGGTNVWVELDSMVVLHIIKKEEGDWKVQHLLTKLRQFKWQMIILFTHVLREANKPADLLANLACQKQTVEILSSPQGSSTPSLSLSKLYRVSLDFLIHG